MFNRIPFAAMALTSVFVVACNKSDSGPAPASSEKKEPATAGTAAGDCGADYKAQDGAFCMALPPGSDVDFKDDGKGFNDEPKKHITFLVKGSGKSGQLDWSAMSYDEVLTIYKSSAAAKAKGGDAMDQGEIPGGGYWSRINAAGRFISYSFLYKIPAGHVSCAVTEFGGEHLPDVIKVCQSIHAPGAKAASFQLPAAPAGATAASPAAKPAGTPPKKK